MYSETFHFFGVFDGHGGKAAAVHCTKYLHQHFLAALRSIDSEHSNGKSVERPKVEDCLSICPLAFHSPLGPLSLLLRFLSFPQNGVEPRQGSEKI
jgi:hypothetical protein